jgi:hypothetical protein
MASQSMSASKTETMKAKPTFLNFDIDIRLRIYYLILEFMILHELHIKPNPKFHDPFASLYFSSRQLQPEIEKWFLSKPMVSFSPSYGYFLLDTFSCLQVIGPEVGFLEPLVHYKVRRSIAVTEAWKAFEGFARIRDMLKCVT